MTTNPGWRVSVGTSRRSSSPGLRAVVSYSAIISSDLEHSSISLESSVPRSLLSSAISLAPEWSKTLWEPPATSSDQDLLTSALRKLLALFEFGAVVPGSSAAEIRDGLQATLSVTLGAGSPTHLKRIEVVAKILENGKAIWGYKIPEPGEWAPGFEPTWVLEAQASSLDVLLQNLVRADLHERLGS